MYIQHTHEKDIFRNDAKKKIVCTQCTSDNGIIKSSKYTNGTIYNYTNAI